MAARTTILNDKSVKWQWRVVYFMAFVLAFANIFLQNKMKGWPIYTMWIWLTVLLCYVVVIFRVRWLYENKREKLQYKKAE